MTARKRAVDALDRIFSIWVRRRAAVDGYVECFTCRVKHRWQDVDAGHFMSRRHMATRWEPQNVHPQCKGCNGFRAGEQFRYGKRLDELYGAGTADRMEQASRRAVKWPLWQLKEEIERVGALVADLD